MGRKSSNNDGVCDVCGIYFKRISKHLSQSQNSCNAIKNDKSVIINKFSSQSPIKKQRQEYLQYYLNLF